jgi:hypothetical protein
MNTVYDNLRQWMDAVPVIESHEHYVGYTEPTDDPIALVTDNYLWSDLESAAGITDAKSLQILKDPSASFEARLSCFERLWSTVKYTGYGRGVALGFRAVWDIEINREGLQKLYERRSERTTAMQEKYIGRYGIKAAVCDVGSGPIIRGETQPIAPWCRFAIGVPQWHNLHSFLDIQNVARDMGLPPPSRPWMITWRSWRISWLDALIGDSYASRTKRLIAAILAMACREEPKLNRCFIRCSPLPEK